MDVEFGAYWEKGVAYMVSLGKPEGKSRKGLRGIRRLSWDHNIKINL
jgi:hypothetical protein